MFGFIATICIFGLAAGSKEYESCTVKKFNSDGFQDIQTFEGTDMEYKAFVNDKDASALLKSCKTPDFEISMDEADSLPFSILDDEIVFYSMDGYHKSFKISTTPSSSSQQTEKQVHGKWEIDVSHFVSDKSANCISVSGSLKFKRNRYEDVLLVESCEESGDDSDYNMVTVIRLSDYFLKADHKYHMCGLCTTSTINSNSDKTLSKEQKIQKMYLNTIIGNNDGGRKLLSFFDCPETCTHSNIAQCNLCDLNCRVCNNDECSQCNDGYFKKDRYTQCTHCQSVFGSECLFCQDFNGCGQCAQGYLRIQDTTCGLWYCLDEYSVGLLDDFSKALRFGIHNFGLNDKYYGDYINWAIDYDKLDAYPIDGSDNYAEIAGRYSNFVDSSDIIEDGNTNFWSRVNTKPGLAQEALRVGIDPTNPVVYEHTEFSDYYEYELELLLGDDSDSSRRRLSHSCSSGDETYFTVGINNLPSLASNIPEQYAPPVTNQGGCGSCWAFGSTGQFDINYNRYIDADEMENRAKFSEEYTVDCAEDCDGTNDNDCDGGTTNDIPSYFERDGHCPYWGYSFGGYRYGDSDNSGCGDCDPDCSVLPTGVVAVRGFGSSFLLNDFLAAVRVVDNGHAVQFRARIKTGDFLKKKITTTFGDLEYWYGDVCGSTLGGHAMVAVGQKRYFNSDEANNYHYYLKVRNSWGPNRHGDGYFWMSQSVVGTDCEPKDFQYNTFGDFPCTPAPGDTICIPDSSRVFTWVPNPETKCSGWRCKEDDFNDNDDNCVTDNNNIDYKGLCPQCENGYFAFHESYKCQQCPENCANCVNFIGCTACNTGYTLWNDECSGVGYCQVTIIIK